MRIIWYCSKIVEMLDNLQFLRDRCTRRGTRTLRACRKTRSRRTISSHS